MVATIFKNAGKSGKTNQSLRVSGIPKKSIQSGTGHKSVEVLRVYERNSKEQQTKAYRALACTVTKPVAATTSTALSDVTNYSQPSAACPSWCQHAFFLGLYCTKLHIQQLQHYYVQWKCDTAEYALKNN